MDTGKKRRLQLGCLILLFSLLAILYLYPQYQKSIPAALLFPESGTLSELYLPENSTLPELHLPGGETVKGWENEDTVYFFLPSYVTADSISLGTGLQWANAESAGTALQYDIIRDIFLASPDGTVQTCKKICFKHSANLFTIYLDLKGNAVDSITKDGFTETEIKVISPGGNIDYHADDGLIKGRGNSTWELDKKPYYLKLSEKAGLCGMEPGRKWILLANAYEATKLSNKLLFDFSKAAGLRYAVDSEWADLYINGEYRGNYLVCEKIDVGEYMVDIADLEQENQKIYESFEPYADEFQKGYITNQSTPPRIFLADISLKRTPPSPIPPAVLSRTAKNVLSSPPRTMPPSKKSPISGTVFRT